MKKRICGIFINFLPLLLMAQVDLKITDIYFKVNSIANPETWMENLGRTSFTYSLPGNFHPGFYIKASIKNKSNEDLFFDKNFYMHIFFTYKEKKYNIKGDITWPEKGKILIKKDSSYNITITVENEFWEILNYFNENEQEANHNYVEDLLEILRTIRIEYVYQGDDPDPRIIRSLSADLLNWRMIHLSNDH